MKNLRIVFMGTPDFSVPTLEALAKSDHEIIGVFCQPDKSKGRGQKLMMPPVKETALAYHLPIYQPDTLRTEEVRQTLETLRPDLMVVVAYGKILPTWMLTVPKYGCINLHASLLPLYRGAAPIQWAILEGEKETGITVMQMDEGMDTGAMLSTIKTTILPGETAGELFDRLSILGGEHIVGIVDDLVSGRLIPVPQDNNQATYTSKVTKEMGLINWQKSAAVIERQIRGLDPWPGAYTYWNEKRIKIWKAEAVYTQDEFLEYSAAEHISTTANNMNTVLPGTIVGITKDSLSVQTGDGILIIFEVQPDNKKRMHCGDFIRGHQLAVGGRFHE